jgi:outer membrane protein assembly factor BamA
MQRAFKYGIWLAGMVLYSFAAFCQEKEEKPFEDAAVLKTSFLTIRNVVITGNKITKKYIIEREIPVKKDQTYSISDILSNLQLARQNLMNTALFVDVTVDFTNWVNDSLDIVADVKERWYWFPIPYFKPIDRNLNVWIDEYHASLERVNYGLKFSGNNVSGRNDKVNFFLISGYTRQIALSYSQPYADKALKKGFFLNVAYAKYHEVNYATEFNKQQFFKDDVNFMREQFHADVGFTYRQAPSPGTPFALDTPWKPWPTPS